MVEQGFSRSWEGPYGEGWRGALPEELGEEMNTSLQFLATNLTFLEMACGRLIHLLESNRACRAHFPSEMAGSLDALETRLDLEFLEAETPKALAEAQEGLDRLAGAVRTLGKGSCHGC